MVDEREYDEKDCTNDDLMATFTLTACEDKQAVQQDTQ